MVSNNDLTVQVAKSEVAARIADALKSYTPLLVLLAASSSSKAEHDYLIESEIRISEVAERIGRMYQQA